MIRVTLDATDLRRLMEGGVVERGGGNYSSTSIEICLADISFDVLYAIVLRAEKKKTGG